MYAVIRKGKLANAKTTTTDALQFLDKALQDMSKIPGFISCYALASGEREVTTISLFETAGGAEESNRFARENVTKARDLLGPVNLEVSQGEVRGAARRRSLRWRWRDDRTHHTGTRRARSGCPRRELECRLGADSGSAVGVFPYRREPGELCEGVG